MVFWELPRSSGGPPGAPLPIIREPPRRASGAFCIIHNLYMESMGTDYDISNSTTTPELESDRRGKARLLPALPGGGYYQPGRYYWRDCRAVL